MKNSVARVLGGVLFLSLLLGTGECSPGQPAPDVSGQWAVTYDDVLRVSFCAYDTLCRT